MYYIPFVQSGRKWTILEFIFCEFVTEKRRSIPDTDSIIYSGTELVIA